MKVAVIGSRTLHLENLSDYIPAGTTEIVSGGAKGIDADAKRYARQNGIALTEFLPDYPQYGRGAPLKRNLQIIEYADIVHVWFLLSPCATAQKPFDFPDAHRNEAQLPAKWRTVFLFHAGDGLGIDLNQGVSHYHLQ